MKGTYMDTKLDAMQAVIWMYRCSLKQRDGSGDTRTARKVRLAIQDVEMVVFCAAIGRHVVVSNRRDAQQTGEAIDVICGSDADVSVQSTSMDKGLVLLIAT